jgi:hypothetical protein
LREGLASEPELLILGIEELDSHGADPTEGLVRELDQLFGRKDRGSK